MAGNQTVPNRQSVEAFLDAVGDAGRRADGKALVTLMEEATGEKATMWGPAIVRFGRYRYKYQSGREGEMMVSGVFSAEGGYGGVWGDGFDGARALLARLGKHTMGKGCLYLKRLEDVDLAVLRALVGGAVEARRERDGAGL